MTAGVLMHSQDIFSPTRAPHWLMGAVAALTLLGLGSHWLLKGAEHPLMKLHVTGVLQNVTAEEVRAALEPELAEPLAQLSLESLKLRVQALPWVARARVEREWPDALRVRIWERQVFARWGESALLDDQGHVFVPSTLDGLMQLPMLSGPAGREDDVMQQYRSLRDLLADSPYALAGLMLDVRGEWTAQTQSGIELRLGRSEPREKIEMLMGPAGRGLVTRLTEVRYVDLRYSNGIAVGWKLAEEGDTNG